MDGITAHLLDRVRDIRETQLSQGQLLDRIAEGMSALRAAASTPPTTSSASWMSIAAGASRWAGGILALSYLAKGGDVGTAMTFLQNLAKLS
jgi:hypothetical protein